MNEIFYCWYCGEQISQPPNERITLHSVQCKDCKITYNYFKEDSFVYAIDIDAPFDRELCLRVYLFHGDALLEYKFKAHGKYPLISFSSDYVLSTPLDVIFKRINKLLPFT